MKDSTIYVTTAAMPHNAFKSVSYDAARRFGRATRAAGVMACGLALLQACSGSDVLSPGTPTGSSAVSHVVGTATVGTMLDAPVRLVVTDGNKRPVAGTTVRWEASEGGKVSADETVTDAKGIASVRWTLATVAGLQSLTAAVPGLPIVIFGANATADKAASVRFSSDIARLTLLGDTVHYATTSLDKYGNTVSTPATMTFEGSTDALAQSGPTFVARNRGTATIKATVDTASARLLVLVDPATPTVSRVWPDTLVPGAAIVVEGAAFALATDAIDLTIGGVKATVTRATASRIEAVLPSTYACAPTSMQPVRVTIAASSGFGAAPLRTVTRLALAKGESANLLDADQVRCTELAAPVGNANAKYVVAVINTNVSAAATAGFELRGTGTGAMEGQTATPRPPAASALMASPLSKANMSAALAQVERDGRDESQHDAHLERQRAVNARYGSPTPTWKALAKTRELSGLAQLARAPLSVGDTITMKALYGTCSAGRDVRARVVYSGSKSVVLEDVAAPRAGTMDEQYRLIGDEFDRVQYPLMQAKVGDPLAMNNAMGGDGRVTMLFTRYVNDSLSGITGYVSACNFYPKGTFAASNADEVFYARVANATESPAEWRRGMRSTVMHEVKHLASFAIRFANGTPFEESWLEESLARVAEELYARSFSNGAGWKENAGYDGTVRCEIFQCDDRPLLMWKHFSVLHQYLRGVDTLTPIGAAANGDFTFYASGWSLVRWAADQYAGDEAVWIKDLVRGGQLTGLSNLAQRTGRPAGEMLADWALANAVDDLPGFTPARPQLSFPSWNQADVFRGLAGTYPMLFSANPLYARAMSFGSFVLPVTKLRAFSSSYFSFEGNQAGSQLIELKGENGGAVPTSLRVAVVRVE